VKAESPISSDAFIAALSTNSIRTGQFESRKTHRLSVGDFFIKKSLCAENAEANSERNLYSPPKA
jgi:hypothetical protein